MRIFVFDSGVGGLSVAAEIMKAMPDVGLDYLADSAIFPYGGLEPQALIDRVMLLMEAVLPDLNPAALVIACNTASTLVLPPLRSRFSLPVVGTVPAVKPAAEHSHSRLVSVLATPGTVKRDYTYDLIRHYGQDCEFTLVGSWKLASLVERHYNGGDVSDAELLDEIAPCFVEKDGRRTDCVALACTHYPLLLDRLQAIAPWPVEWIDPAPAIARRVVSVTAEMARAPQAGERRQHSFRATGSLPSARFLEAFGFTDYAQLPL